jgi:hypothetical protein
MRRLFSAVKLDDHPHAIVRELTQAERRALTDRATELRAALWGYVSGERDEVEASIAAMFGGFRSMRQEGDAAEGLVTVTAAVLRDFPAWAIAKGCLKIAQNQAGLDRRWPPNDTEIHDVVAEIVREYRKTLEIVEALLLAPVEDREPLPAPTIAPNDVRPTGMEPNAPLVERKPVDGRHAARVAADIAARKASANAPHETSGQL